VGAFVVLLTGYLSFKTRKRALYMVVCAPFVTIGYSLYISSMDPQVRYAAVRQTSRSCPLLFAQRIDSH